MLVFFNPIKFGITFSFGNLLAIGRFVLRISMLVSGDIWGYYSVLFVVAVYVYQSTVLPFIYLHYSSAIILLLLFTSNLFNILLLILWIFNNYDELFPERMLLVESLFAFK